jgi:tRNA threonylcarbamoyladenosine biosynthesis protein TsaB
VADSGILASEQRLQTQGQAESLLPMIEAAMHHAGLAYRDLDLIAVTVGPGTFTGLRIGLAAARGLSLASGIPCAGATTLEALAEGVPPSPRVGRSVLAVIDARRGEFYAQCFDADLTPLGPPRLQDRSSIVASLPAGPVALVGSGAALLAPILVGREAVLDVGPENPTAAAVAMAALRRGRPAAGAPAPSPLYLRQPDAKLPAANPPVPRS